eukprot:CAMPEP_0184855258 /NCGR_PEP_ID=MMETSP0580-20130426/557_1 /TAXON_ID=1118495 /ORGANISM="Dactyliosolen fragilissimus" /LENGTH=379 /DNA_ID=CAMNT_0027349727 /DNA_START=590 /DNA_END=1729 /DNA_ORIENTATION=+
MSETYLNLLLNAKNWKFAVNELKSNPKDACIWNETYASDGRTLTSRVLPIHTACALNAPVQIVRSLIVANRSGLKEPDNKGFLPIHYACSNFALKDVIYELIHAYPQSVDIIDPSGMFPLHLAAYWGPSSLGVIKILLKAMNKNLITSAFDGATALDLANSATYDLRNSVVLLLMKSGYFSQQTPESPKLPKSSYDKSPVSSNLPGSSFNKIPVSSNPPRISPGKSSVSHESLSLSSFNKSPSHELPNLSYKKNDDESTTSGDSSKPLEKRIRLKETTHPEPQDPPNVRHMLVENEFLKMEVEKLKISNKKPQTPMRYDLMVVENEALKMEIEKLKIENDLQRTKLQELHKLAEQYAQDSPNTFTNHHIDQYLKSPVTP